MLDEPPVDYYQVTVFVVGTVCLVFPRRTLPDHGRAPDYTVAESYWFWIWFVVALLFRVALWFLIPRVSCKHESDEGD